MPKDFVTKLRAGSPFAIFAATVKQRIAQDDAAKQREREAKQAKAEAERRKLTAFKTAMKNQVAKLERAERRERNPAAEIREANAMSDALTAARTAEAEADDALAIFFSAQRKIQGARNATAIATRECLSTGDAARHGKGRGAR